MNIDKNRSTTVAVGLITRNRPLGLKQVLESFLAMTLPSNADVFFIIVENDLYKSQLETVSDFRESIHQEVLYEIEPNLGIPIARNRVLQIALERKATYLTFVDDDEIVSSSWLVNLVDGMEKSGCDLGGGPMNFIPPKQQLGVWQYACYEFTAERMHRRNLERAKVAKNSGSFVDFDIYTHNWCARLETVRRLNLRFDERLKFTGGSDTHFSLALRKNGGKIGWFNNSETSEYLPVQRLELGYIFRRARDQGINAAKLRYKGHAKAVSYIINRLIGSTALLITSPLMGKRNIVGSVFKFGQAVGWALGLAGRTSLHYK